MKIFIEEFLRDSHINSLVAVKKQLKRKTPPPEIGFAYFPLKEIC